MNLWLFLFVGLDVDMEPKSVMDMALLPNIDPIDIGLGSSEKGNANAVTTAKPRKKTMTSVYLKFFETAPDGKSRRCKFCGQSYSIATATGNFLCTCFLVVLFLIILTLFWYLFSPIPCNLSKEIQGLQWTKSKYFYKQSTKLLQFAS